MLGVISNFREVVDIEIKLQDNNTKEISLEVNDILTVSYIKNCSLKTSTGKVINMDRVNNTIKIDCSDKYSSNIETISIANIRDIEIDNSHNLIEV